MEYANVSSMIRFYLQYEESSAIDVKYNIPLSEV